MKRSKWAFARRAVPLVVIGCVLILSAAPHFRNSIAGPSAGGNAAESDQLHSLDRFVPEFPERLIAGEQARVFVEKLLESLTKEGFARREEVVAALADADLETAAALAAIAQETAAPFRRRARYMIRRVFDRVGPRLLEHAVDAPLPQKTRGEQVFLVLAEVAPLDEHNHGDWQKRGMFYEKFGYPAKAAEAYRRWVPPGSFCGTCAAAIAGERIAGMVRCLQQAKQYDEASQLILEHPSLDLLLRLVENYHAQGRLSEVAEDLRNQPRVSAEKWSAVKEYVGIRKDLEAKRWERLIPYLHRGMTRRPRHVYDLLFDLEHSDAAAHWRLRVVAEGLARFPEQTGRLLIEQLRLAEAREARRPSRGQYSQRADPSAVAGIVYALLHIKTPAAVEAVQAGRYLNWPSGEEYPIVRDFLAVRADDRIDEWLRLLEDDSKSFDALTALVGLGVDTAVEPLIQHLGDPSHTARVIYSLWRRTGLTLGTDQMIVQYEQQRARLRPATPGGKLPAEQERKSQQLLGRIRDRWLAWWQFEGATLAPKPPGWWGTPEAEPLLLKALESPSPYIQRTARTDLIALEHPILANQTERLDVAKFWLRFDPPACIPTLIEYADVRGLDMGNVLFSVTRQSFGTDKAAWQQWWQREGRHLEFAVDDRWW